MTHDVDAMRSALVLARRRALAVAWMRNNNVERVDREPHDAAQIRASCEWFKALKALSDAGLTY